MESEYKILNTEDNFDAKNVNDYVYDDIQNLGEFERELARVSELRGREGELVVYCSVDDSVRG